MEKISRRNIVKGAGAAAAAAAFNFQVVPSRVFGANDKITLAGIGTGGKGASDIGGSAGAGFEIVDLGKDVPPQVFVDTAEKEDAGIIGMSSLLTTTAPAMARVIEILKERGLDGKIKTIVGGAPVSQDLAVEIGADAYGFDAANAVETAKGIAGV